MSNSPAQLRLFNQPSAKPLFSEHFLRDRLPELSEYRLLNATELARDLSDLWQAEKQGLADANEAQTEERWIQPVLKLLGYEYTVQVGLKFATGRRQPDYALFLDDASRAAANAHQDTERFSSAIAVADAKRFDRPLDKGGASGDDSGHPVAQIINYVYITRREWGVLTNGRNWRLYSARSGLSEGSCIEIDLVESIEAGGEALRDFLFFFGAASFAKNAQGDSLLDRCLDETIGNAVAVGDQLKQSVFAAVPLVAEGLIGDDSRTRENLARAFENALIVLYRLLFCLHAEARGLLPIGDRVFETYSLKEQKRQIASELIAQTAFSRNSSARYASLQALFQIVDRGDPDLNVTAYNGGLFSTAEHPYLVGRSVPDHLMAQALDMVCRVNGEFVDYRDLSVRHLGTIYEELLEFDLAETEGHLCLVPGAGRHESGSYFTPERVVELIVQRTLEPILEARSAEIGKAGLTGADAIHRFLEIKVLDPAIGSGHFLVTAADYMAQSIATDPSVGESAELNDIRRVVVERCVYGVDINPLAVELARLSLWLTSAKESEPLSFVQNVRCGNSLVGTSLAQLLTEAKTLESELLANDLSTMLANYRQIVSIDSHSADEVHRKQDLARAAAEVRDRIEHSPDEELAGIFRKQPTKPFHWDLEFPEVFLNPDTGEPEQGAGFDAVIGNPPYVRIQELGRELAEYCRKQYRTARGSFDVYVPFIERAVSLLGSDGRLGYIIPNKFLKLDYGKDLRALLAEEKLIDEIIDFGDAQVFAGATNYTCVLTASRGGVDRMTYRKLLDTGSTGLRDALTNPDAIAKDEFDSNAFGDGPWLLASGSERDLLDHLASESIPLGETVKQIFQGLITSADPIYIVEDRGAEGTLRRVFSKASGREILLEPDLLHPLASGIDVDRYAFKPLKSLLLFPYRRNSEADAMELVPSDALSRLTATAAYLAEHESVLRGRESGKMDHDGWYGYVYPKSLGLHTLPKLGVPRLCARLRASIDPAGETFLDNVDVNGIVETSQVELSIIALLLNSRVLDYYFRRLSVPFRGQFMSANKQFIAPLPIRPPEGELAEEMRTLGGRLHQRACDIGNERRGFVDWLDQITGLRLDTMEKTGTKGSRKLLKYELHEPGALLRELAKNRDRLSEDPLSRGFGERFVKEHTASVTRLAELKTAQEADERRADDLVYELYELSSAQRQTIEAEYSNDHP